MDSISPTPQKLKSFQQRIGWKIFALTDRKELLFKYQRHNGCSLVECNSWLTSSRKTRAEIFDTRTKTWRRYYLRFHIYLQRPTLFDNEYVVRKVRWRGLVTTGYQTNIPVVVANQLLVGKLK
jgi:hypothetical protein